MYAYPDLMIACGQPRFHDQRGDVLLNPTVIFEVLSPSTEKYDRGEKFRRYRTQIESLQDYVMVSQDKPRIEHHQRQAHPEHREEQVKTERGADLAATGREVGDDCQWKCAHRYLLRNIADTE